MIPVQVSGMQMGVVDNISHLLVNVELAEDLSRIE